MLQGKQSISSRGIAVSSGWDVSITNCDDPCETFRRDQAYYTPVQWHGGGSQTQEAHDLFRRCSPSIHKTPSKIMKGSSVVQPPVSCLGNVPIVLLPLSHPCFCHSPQKTHWLTKSDLNGILSLVCWRLLYLYRHSFISPPGKVTHQHQGTQRCLLDSHRQSPNFLDTVDVSKKKKNNFPSLEYLLELNGKLYGFILSSDRKYFFSNCQVSDKVLVSGRDIKINRTQSLLPRAIQRGEDTILINNYSEVWPQSPIRAERSRLWAHTGGGSDFNYNSQSSCLTETDRCLSIMT